MTAREAAAVADYRDGVPVRDILFDHRVSLKTLFRWCEAAGVARRRPGLRWHRLKESTALDAVQMAGSFAGAARELGVDRLTVVRALSRRPTA